MLTIHIEDELEIELINLAEREHVQPEQLVKKLITDYTQSKKKQPELLTDFAVILADSPSFQGDPLDIQKAMRDEWD